MRYNLLFRWFVGLANEDAVCDHSVFSMNGDRFLEHEVVEAFFTEVMSLADKPISMRSLLNTSSLSDLMRWSLPLYMRVTL
ncbi:transposase (plasmid) [Burkholderia sp. M6-3]